MAFKTKSSKSDPYDFEVDDTVREGDGTSFDFAEFSRLTPGTATCADPSCGATFPVTKMKSRNKPHCSTCHRDFAGIHAFDAHRADGSRDERICLEPVDGSTMNLPDGEATQWHLDDDQRWALGLTDTQRRGRIATAEQNSTQDDDNVA